MTASSTLNCPSLESIERDRSSGDHASYVISKIAASEYVEHYAQEYRLQGINLQFTGLLGYEQPGFYLGREILSERF